MATPQVGERWRFKPSGSSWEGLGPRARESIGQEVTIKKVIDRPDNEHDEEVLPMFLVEFNDGDDDLEVWQDELEAIS